MVLPDPDAELAVPSSSGSKGKGKGKGKREEPLSLDDCLCPVCLDLFLEPVTLPCTHTFCKVSTHCRLGRYELESIPDMQNQP